MAKEISLTEYEQEEFTRQWNEVCEMLKNSNADLSKIEIVVKEKQ